MTKILAIAVGGALGALSRYWVVGVITSLFERSFPFGTLVVNILGSLLIGILYVLIIEKLDVAAEWHAILMVGFIGAFTTFSTFSLETLILLQEGRVTAALTYIFSSVCVCLLAVALGMWGTKQLF
ncbi:MAG: fluoride efflux transporter CrcB [Pseudomonadales bacterium]|nr:fluoride efflux transporter CrcB [Pseudomonadales bacterium]MCP5214953.1 fluoride efflux transporter CrcB [Pseudomonadales bacterium]